MRVAVFCLLALTSVARAEKDKGAEFIDDAKLLYRIAACGGSDPIDEKLTKIVDKHCKAINERLEKFRAEYFVKHREWFATVVPKDARSEEHTSELQSRLHLVCRLLLEKKNTIEIQIIP